MANHFDVVSVGTDDERRIVVRVIVRAKTRRTVVLATGLQGRAMEGFDLLPVLGHERQVKVPGFSTGRRMHREVLSSALSSMPSGPSETTAMPIGSSALRKNALLAS